MKSFSKWVLISILTAGSLSAQSTPLKSDEVAKLKAQLLKASYEKALLQQRFSQVQAREVQLRADANSKGSVACGKDKNFDLQEANEDVEAGSCVVKPPDVKKEEKK